MTPWQRSPEHPAQWPGDLYLDPALPDSERVAVSCGAWTAEATHVWTGGGWSRLLTTPVRLVPGAVPAPVAVVAPLAVVAAAVDRPLLAS